MSTNSKTIIKDQEALQNESHALGTHSTTDPASTNNDDDEKQGKETVIQIESTHETLEHDGKASNSVKPTWVYLMNVGGMQTSPTMGSPIGEENKLNYTPGRNGFVALVFAIVLAMIIATAAITLAVYTVEPIQQFFWTASTFLSIMGIFIMVVTSYAMTCSSCARQLPCNIVCLTLAVIGMSIACSLVTIRYQVEIVLLAVITTAGVVFICLLLALSSFDFTSSMLYIIMISAAVGIGGMVIGIYMMISGVYIQWLHMAILFAGLIVNVVVLAMELQLILGGKAVQLEETDYALGAFLIYTSIIDIFLKLVQIFGGLLFEMEG